MADTGKPVPKAATAPAVPAKDSTGNAYENDVVGNKTDTPVPQLLNQSSNPASLEGYIRALEARGQDVFMCTADSGSTTSIVSAQMVGFATNTFGDSATVAGRWFAMVIRNANSVGVAPETEIQPITAYVSATGTFTTGTFTSAIEVNDIIMIIHLTALVGNIIGSGIFTATSATVPADSTGRQSGKATKYYDGCLLMPLTGSAAMQQRRILRFTTSTGVFTIDPARPFTAATGTVPYVILQSQDPNLSALYFGTFTSYSDVRAPADTTAGGLYGNEYFKGCVIMPLTGGAAFQPRIIKQFTATSGIFTLDEPLTTVPTTPYAYVILPQQVPIQRLLDIFDETNAILELKETGYSQLTTDGTEQVCYINNLPQGVFKPLNFLIDCTAMAAGDEIHVRVSYILKSGGNYIKITDTTFNGAQDPAGKNFELLPNRFGVKVTVQRTALGVDRAYDWEVYYENA